MANLTSANGASACAAAVVAIERCALCVELQLLVLLRHVFLVVICVLSFFGYGAPLPRTGAPPLRTGAPWATAPIAAAAM